eukprot:c32844_g1_i1.p2 GENE.c32844_g1_i1~~c32844_g1_i1.p2  ORF type:complete len:139 (+),score=21.07 c32844_g1_i1:93-509(+)
MLRSAAATISRVATSTSRTVHTRVRSQGSGAIHKEVYSPEQNGYLFGERPLPPGVKRKREGWEIPTYIGYSVAALLLVVGLSQKPETSIMVWAEEESYARRKRVAEFEKALAKAEEAEGLRMKDRAMAFVKKVNAEKK